MELNLATKPRPVVVRALRALMPPLLEKWGDAPNFRDQARPILQREAGATLSADDCLALSDQTYRAVVRFRSAHFRPLENAPSLDAVYKGLDAGLNPATANPVMSGALWLAYRLQGAAIQYLNSAEGRAVLVKAEASLATPPMAWQRQLGGEGSLSLERIEAVIAERIQQEQGAGPNRFSTFAVAGRIVERSRSVARKPPAIDQGDAPPREPGAAERLADALAEHVRNAELGEARTRFSKLTPDETAKRFDAFKLQLLRMAAQVAKYAPAGFEPFCQAIEALLYPYPAQVEWIRAFVKPLWTNASQSTLFEGPKTTELVNQRYQLLRKAKQGNPVLIELARAFALVATKTAEQEEATGFLKDLDMVGELQWPSTLEDVKARWSKGRPA
jgi:hypothetical protein